MLPSATLTSHFELRKLFAVNARPDHLQIMILSTHFDTHKREKIMFDESSPLINWPLLGHQFHLVGKCSGPPPQQTTLQ